MQISEYENIFKNEQTHFYYVGNHKIILSLIKKFMKNKKKIRKLKILDAGCGTGFLAKRLARFGDVLGVDNNSQALSLAKKRRIKVKKASITKLPFVSNYFDLVTCIDVINHKAVTSEKAAAKEFYRVLKPKGILLIRASANSWLELVHDKHVHLRKRYDKGEFQNILKKAGFIIMKLSYVNLILLPPVIVLQFIEKIQKPKTTKSAIFPLPYWLNWILTFLLSLEAYLLRWFDLPFGIGLLAVCQKPEPNVKIS